MGHLLSIIPAERPRERLLTHGSSALSDSELLAILLGTGRRGTNALELAQQVLAQIGDLAGLSHTSESELQAIPGLGPARTAIIHAALELGKRATGSRPTRGQLIGNAADVWTHFRARLFHVPVEEFWVVSLDVRHRILQETCGARGSLTGVEVHPRDVFRSLIRQGAAAVLFCHNHPSGDPTPSRQDLDLTARLKSVGELCGIKVVDHVIVGMDGFVSLAERGFV